MAIALFYFDISKGLKLCFDGGDHAFDAGLYLRDGVARDAEFGGNFPDWALLNNIGAVDGFRLRRKRRPCKRPLNRCLSPRKPPFRVDDCCRCRIDRGLNPSIRIVNRHAFALRPCLAAAPLAYEFVPD